ncbi:hypothetical protein LDENG_00178760 [Lucifuga dentata]|nr:hypothetical protein LDENG_00178760 [Lucifuga dentata]
MADHGVRMVPVCEAELDFPGQPYCVSVLRPGYCLPQADGTFRADGTISLITGPKTILVDTGGPWNRDFLLMRLKERGLEPGDINLVVGTHGHSDHIGNLNLFPDALLIVGFDVSEGDTYRSSDLAHGQAHCVDQHVSVIPSPGHTGQDVSVQVTGTSVEHKKQHEPHSTRKWKTILHFISTYIMCTGECSKFIAISLYILATVSVICNIMLFFPDFKTDYVSQDSEEDRITAEVKYMGGLIGGGIMVLIPAIHIHLTSANKCCANRCGMFLSIGFAAAGVAGALYSLSVASLGLANGPLCQWRNEHNPFPKWGTPFSGSNASYLADREIWNWCIDPKNVVEFNVALFSTLLVAAGVELVLCLIQMVNGLFGCICGTCSGKEVRSGVLRG